jgi:hypothetical protein
VLLAPDIVQSRHAASSHSCKGARAWAQDVPLVLSSSAMHPATLKLSPAASLTRALVLAELAMHPQHVAFVVSAVHAWQEVWVEEDEAHAVTNAEMFVGVHWLSDWAGVTNAGTCELDTVDAGVGQTGPVLPLLEPELEPEELPELEPEDPPELEPDELLEPDPPPEPPPLPPPEPPPEPPPLPPPELPPDPEPPLPPPDPPPLLEPVPGVHAWLALKAQAVVSVHEAQVNVCPPTV